MEHIEGCLLLNKIEEREKRSSNTYRTNKDLIKKLLGWLEEFYQLGEGRIIRDINLRNFILTNDGVLYGIDFEDVSLGEIGEDIGKLCAFILTYYPALTWWKLEFTRELFNLSLEQFSLDRDNLLRELDKQINKINKKRKKNYSLKSFKDILLADAQ